MKRRKAILKEARDARYYEKHGVLKEMVDEPVELSLRTELRRSIILGKRKKKLKNISIKVDPLQIQAIKKVAAMKSIPYQILIRHWLSQNLKEELQIE
jgi:hypothetical protein